MNLQNEDNINKIVTTINEYRKQSKLDDLIYINGLPDFIINGNSLVKFTLDNIIKIGDRKYLFRFPLGEFLKKLNEKNILKILSFDYLKKIKIAMTENYEYILVYDDRIDEYIQVRSDTSISERVDLNIRQSI
jgi:hypothetical protein